MQAAREVLGGIEPSVFDELEAQVGTKRLLEAAGELGRHASGPLDAEQATAAVRALDAIAGLKRDPVWVEAYLNGGKAERERLAELHRKAYR